MAQHQCLSLAHWHSAHWAWNGYQPGLGSIPRPGRINCFRITGAHALRLISRAGKSYFTLHQATCRRISPVLVAYPVDKASTNRPTVPMLCRSKLSRREFLIDIGRPWNGLPLDSHSRSSDSVSKLFCSVSHTRTCSFGTYTNAVL